MTDTVADPTVREVALRALWSEGRVAWPALALDASAFVEWASGLALGVAPERLHAADVYLVAAALLGVPGAVRAFIEGPLAAAEASVIRVLSEPEARAELMQELAVHLLTPGESSDPRLGQYDGRAPLRAWLRMTAARRALNKGRGKTKLVDFDAVAFDHASDHDPELSVLRRAHRGDIAAIFAEAITVISNQDRALLRLHYVQGSTLAELAAIQRTSRSSLHRQLESVREALFLRIGELMRQRMRLSASQQGSMLRIFHSDLRDALGELLKNPG